MQINTALILCAGYGKRLNPITLKIPKPLIEINEITLLENSINFLEKLKIKNIKINTYYLHNQIQNFILNYKSNSKIDILNDGNEILDTGGGILNLINRSNENDFIVLNPDTLWNNDYSIELKLLEQMYFETKKTCLLLVNKNLSFDPTFKGDFNLNRRNQVLHSKDCQYIFTGLQIMDRSIFNFIKENLFSMNLVWDHLILSNNLYGLRSEKKFYHLNTKNIFDKILKLNFID